MDILSEIPSNYSVKYIDIYYDLSENVMLTIFQVDYEYYNLYII